MGRGLCVCGGRRKSARIRYLDTKLWMGGAGKGVSVQERDGRVEHVGDYV